MKPHHPHILSQERPTRRSSLWFSLIIVVLLLAVSTGLLLSRGGYLLVASGPLPDHAQASVVLEGSVQGETARRAGAMQLLLHGRVGKVMIAVPSRGFWGQPIPEVASRYLQATYGSVAAQHVAFCVMPSGVDSTADEARALINCLKQRDWRSIILVTSNFHTRRARMIWRRLVSGTKPPFHIWVEGVADGTYQPSDWWRKRIYAKTWLLETTKLIENYFFEGR